jgi:hypothetical protein
MKLSWIKGGGIFMVRAVLLLALGWGACNLSAAPDGWPGTKSSFHGYDQFNFKVQDFQCRPGKALDLASPVFRT